MRAAIILSAILASLGFVNFATAADPTGVSALKSFYDQDETDRRLYRFFGGRTVVWFSKALAVDEMVDGLTVREPLTPYVTEDGNILLTGHTAYNENRRVAALFSIDGTVLAAGALYPLQDGQKTTYRLEIVSKTKGQYSDAIRKWATIRAGSFVLEETALADLR